MYGREERERVSGGCRQLLECTVWGLVPGLLSVMAMLFGVALLLSSGRLPVSLWDEYVIAIAFAGASVSGMAAVRRQGRGAPATGVCAGALLLLATRLLAVLIPGGSIAGSFSLKIVVCCLAGGVFGGAIGRMGKKPARRRR